MKKLEVYIYDQSSLIFFFPKLGQYIKKVENILMKASLTLSPSVHVTNGVFPQTQIPTIGMPTGLHGFCYLSWASTQIDERRMKR